MGLIRGLLRFFFMRAVELSILMIILLFLPNIPPYCKIETPYKVAPTKPFEGKLSLNEKLSNIEFWHKDMLEGAESFASFNGELFTGFQTGEVVKLTGDKHISPIVQFGKPCKYFEEAKCGRPLGMVFDKSGALYVADAYYGIYKVDVKTGQKVQLVSPEVEIDGKKPKLFNSVAVASTGEIYWTDSSTAFHLNDGFFEFLSDGNGRLLKYDPKTKRNTVLIDGLHFANGLMLSQNEDMLIVAVTNRNELLKYHLKGSKVGKHETLIDGLPGSPDNLRPDGHGGILVPLAASHDDAHPNVVQIFGPFPWIRKLVSRGFGLLEFSFEMIDRVYPNDYAKIAVHMVGHLGYAMKLRMNKRASVLHISESGEILDSFHSTKGDVHGVSEAFIHNEYLLLGSPFNKYIGRVELKSLGLREIPVVKPVVKATPTTTTAKPTTTTPKPTTTTPKPTTTTPKPTTTTPKPTTTTTKPSSAKPATKQPEKREIPATKPTVAPKVTTTTPKPPAKATEAPKVTTTTQKPTTTTPKSTTTTQKPTTVKPKPAAQATPKPAQKATEKPIVQTKKQTESTKAPPSKPENAGKASEPSQNKV